MKRSFDQLVAVVARAKRRMDRIGGLLMCAEAAHGAAVRELDRAIADACRTPTRKQRTHCDKMPQKGNTVASQASNGELHR